MTMLAFVFRMFVLGTITLPVARAELNGPDYAKGVVFKLTELWPDFLRNRHHALDLGLLSEIDRRYEWLRELDRQDAGFRASSFIYMFEHIMPLEGMERVAFHCSGAFDRTLGPAKTRLLRQWIEISEDVRHHRWSRCLIMHEAQHAFDMLTGWATVTPIPGHSLSAVGEYRARRAELELLRRALDSAQRLELLREEAAKKEPGPFRANFRFANRLIAVQTGIDREVMAEIFHPFYLDRVLCEMGLVWEHERLPNHAGLPK